MLLQESHEDQDDLLRPYLGYDSDDSEETGHALYGASVFMAYCWAPELKVAYRFDSAVRCWLVGDDGPIPDKTLKPCIESFRPLRGTLRRSGIVRKTPAAMVIYFLVHFFLSPGRNRPVSTCTLQATLGRPPVWE